MKRGPLDRVKLMLDAKVVVEHYNQIVEGIPSRQRELDGKEADFVMTVEDYETLRDFALQEHSRNESPSGEPKAAGRESESREKGPVGVSHSRAEVSAPVAPADGLPEEPKGIPFDKRSPESGEWQRYAYALRDLLKETRAELAAKHTLYVTEHELLLRAWGIVAPAPQCNGAAGLIPRLQEICAKALAAEAALETTRAQWAARETAMLEHMSGLSAATDIAEAALGEAREDAERYRWLRSRAKRSPNGKKRAGDIAVFQWADRTEANLLSLDALDSAVDLARKSHER